MPGLIRWLLIIFQVNQLSGFGLFGIWFNYLNLVGSLQIFTLTIKLKSRDIEARQGSRTFRYIEYCRACVIIIIEASYLDF